MKQIFFFVALLLPFCAVAQFQEMFDGTHLNATHPWTSQSERYTLVNGALQYDGSKQTGTTSFYTPISYSANMEWFIDVSLAFKSSNNNNARIYLYTTGKPTEICYYVQVGHNDHNVSLYQRKGGAAPTRVINGIKNRLSDNGSSLRIKVTMEKEQKWTLYTSTNKNTYRQEGMHDYGGRLPDLIAKGNFNINCISKAATLTGMIYTFDNIGVSPHITPTPPESDEPEEPTDPEEPTTAPKLLSITEEDSHSLLITFDQKVEPSKSHFLLNDEPSEELYLSTDQTVVKPVWATPRKKDAPYTLSYSGLRAVGGTTSYSGTKQFVSNLGGGSGTDPNPADIYISEIMADPNGLTALPPTEYIELHNASSTTWELEGWSLAYSGRIIYLANQALPPGGYLLLYRSGREVTVDKGGIAMPLDLFPAQLANEGKQLLLYDPSNALIDEITYPKARPGVAWERNGKTLYPSTNPRGGTPGSKNSATDSEPEEPENPTEGAIAQPDDLCFNEVLPNPFVGGKEYIELYNRSNNDITLAGLAIANRKTDGTLSTHYPLSPTARILKAGSYLLLTEEKEGVSSFYHISSPEALLETNLPVLSNLGATLVLFRTTDEEVIDQLSYSSKWHSPSIKEQKGVSLERIDPDGSTQAASNWASATQTAGHGTPGYRNSQYNSGTDNPPSAVEPPVYSDASGQYTIAYYLNEAGYNCRAWVFDTAGRKRAEIANHQLLGSEGSLTWDGTGTDGSKLLPGIYLFYIELYHPAGHTLNQKRAFLVR